MISSPMRRQGLRITGSGVRRPHSSESDIPDVETPHDAAAVDPRISIGPLPHCSTV